jgi:BolA protein
MIPPTALTPPVPVEVTADAIHAHLAQHLSPSALQVLDESGQHAGHAGANGTGFGTHFRVRIASSQFKNLSKVQCHRLVYDSLRPFFDAGLHALALETFAAAPTSSF